MAVRGIKGGGKTGGTQFKDTMANSRERSAAENLNELLSIASANLHLKDGRLDTEHTDVVDVERKPQLSVELSKVDGLRVTLPWIQFQKGCFHQTTASEVFLELVFTYDNVIVRGRGLLEINEFVKFQALGALAEAHNEDDGLAPFYIHQLLIITGGDGRSLFNSDFIDRSDFGEFLEDNPRLKLRPESELELSGTGAELLSLETGIELELEGLDINPAILDELGGHPAHVEEIRRGVQHRHRTDELRAARKDHRKIDTSKLRH